MSNHRATGLTRRWGGGIGIAAAAAAMIGAAGAPAARADDGSSLPADIGLLNSAETNIGDAFNLSGQTDTVYPDVFGQLEAIQTPLLSSDNSLVSGVGEVLFNSPDQHLAEASDSFLSAAEAYAADPTSATALGDFASTSFQLDGAMLRMIPSAVIGKLTDQIFDIGGFDTTSASAVTDLASSAASTADSPDGVIGEAITELNQGTALLDAAPTADLTAFLADGGSLSATFDALADTFLATAFPDIGSFLP